MRKKGICGQVISMDNQPENFSLRASGQNLESPGLIPGWLQCPLLFLSEFNCLQIKFLSIDYTTKV